MNLDGAAHQAADVDYVDRYGLVAVAPDDVTVLGHGCFMRGPGAREAEVAFAVGDALRGEGIATTRCWPTWPRPRPPSASTA